jgi:DNA mismatch repair ATPase MutS
MNPETWYKERLLKLTNDRQILLKKKSRLAWLRFAAIISIAACWYFLNPMGLVYFLIPSFLLLVIFTRLVFTDLKNKSAIEHNNYLVTINEGELKALAHNYYHFEDGNEFIPKEHFYANDLDIFGHASLYQYINRTSSEMGSSSLANWLLKPAYTDTILQRQVAVKELTAKNEWRQKLQAFGAEKKIQTKTKNRLQDWFKEENRFINNKLWLLLRYLLPAIILTVIALNIADVINNYVRNYFLLAATVIAFYISKKVTPLHQHVSKMANELEVLSESIQFIEQTEFKAPFLQDLQSQFRQQNGTASAKLKQLKNILERLDMRYNIVVFIPIAILLQWDLQQVIALEKWKQQNHKNVIEWFNALGSFEAVNSLATLSFNHPQWCFPVFAAEHFFIEGKNIGHPLIQADKCVNNPVKIDNTGELMLVTGSNMAGKSTYLRSIGINIILAMAGAPVCAGYFCLSPVQIISSMRIADNLEENTSTFYAELKKLKTVIDRVNNKERVFILLDEILRGTNSLDRHTGSVALIKQLIKHNAAGIIATHDVELAKMKEDYPTNILNYHFDVQVSNDELYFDYRLKEGICTSLNASILMKKIGIEL